MRSLEELKHQLQNPKSIVILPHTKPDADALGSSLALMSLMKKMGHKVNIISPTDYPAFLNWIHGQDEVIQYTEAKAAEIKTLISESDIIFALDFCALKRVDKLEAMVRESKAEKVLIDHHIGKEDFADYELWSSKASSTAELIYDFIHLMDLSDKMGKHEAEAIYAGIMTDTGSFRFPATSRKVHLIIADLMEYDIDHAKIHRLVYDNNRLKKLQLLGYALSQKLKFLPEYNAAYISLSEKDLEEFNYRTGDSEGLVNYALSLKGVVFAALITEKDDGVKCSFRSVGEFNVNEYASKHFNGGGHKNAAGGRIEGSLESALSKFENSLKEYKEELVKQSELENTLC
ncbi:MAG: bifunctional oligoribonuclease/PAP phosphatase NrnA [Cytophagales bacterium]